MLRKIALYSGFTLSGAKSFLVAFLRLKFIGLIKFLLGFRKYKLYSTDCREYILEPHLNDNTAKTKVSKYYFYQDVWGFETILDLRPKNIVDIGASHVLVGMLSKITNVESLDVRPLDVSLKSLKAVYGDITNLPYINESVELLNSLCVLEHIGLGRYGDKIDSGGFRRACEEISRVLKPGGHLVLSVPVGKPIIVFNAHRVFSKKEFLSYFSGFEIIREVYCTPEYSESIQQEKLVNGKHHVYCVCLKKI